MRSDTRFTNLTVEELYAATRLTSKDGDAFDSREISRGGSLLGSGGQARPVDGGGVYLAVLRGERVAIKRLQSLSARAVNVRPRRRCSGNER